MTRILGGFAALSIFLMMALTFLDVVGRYFLGAPLPGAEDIKAFLLGLTVFAALPLVTLQQRHIAVRSLAVLLRGRALAIQRLVVQAGAAAGLGFMAYLLFDQAQAMREDGTLTNYLDLPLAPAVYVMAALAALAALIAASLLRHGGGPAGPEAARPE